MPRIKVLRCVAHNFGHSFTSAMNYVEIDYFMGHLLVAMRAHGESKLHIDLVNRQVTPAILNTGPVKKSIDQYLAWFPKFVQQSGSSPDFVAAGTLEVDFDLQHKRWYRRTPWIVGSPYQCRVQLADSRGKEWSAEFSGWWFPQPGRWDKLRWYAARWHGTVRRLMSRISPFSWLTQQSTRPARNVAQASDY